LRFLETHFRGTGGIFRFQHLDPYDRKRWEDCKICVSQTNSPVDTTGVPSSLSGTF
jgi:hypothetical protein